MPVDTDTSALAAELRVVIGRVIRRLRAEHGFSLTHGAVLGRLDRDGALSTGDLAAAERVRPQSMGQTLAELEAGGLVSRRPDTVDRRRTLIEVTDHGREVLAEERARREGWLAEAIETGFSPREQDVLRRAVPLLDRLAEL